MKKHLNTRASRVVSLLVALTAILVLAGPSYAMGDYPTAPWAIPATGVVGTGFEWAPTNTLGHNGIDICAFDTSKTSPPECYNSTIGTGSARYAYPVDAQGNGMYPV